MVAVADQDEDMFNCHIIPFIAPELRDLVTTVAGGQQRHYSIASGVRQLVKDEVTTIIVHDAVRPLINIKLLDKLIAAAAKHGAAGPVTPLTSTVVSMSDDGMMDTALERNCYRESQMPQVFRAEVIMEAYEKCSKRDLDFGTECLDLVKKYTSSDVSLIEGNGDHLWKVTYRKDLAAASYCLEDDVSEVLLKHDSNDVQRHERKQLINKLELVIKSYTSYHSLNSRRSSLNGASCNEFNRSASFSDSDDSNVSIYIRFSSSAEQLECQIRDLESLILGEPSNRDHHQDRSRSPLPKPDMVRNIYLMATSCNNGQTNHGQWARQLYSEFDSLVVSTKRSLPSIAIVYTIHYDGDEKLKNETRLLSLIQSLSMSPSLMTGQIIIL